MPFKNVRSVVLYSSLIGGLVIGAFYLRELRLIHVAVERIKDGLCSNGCDIHHLLTKLHPKFDILRLFLLAMCAIVLAAVAAVNRKGMFTSEGFRAEDDASAMELVPTVQNTADNVAGQTKERYSLVPNDIV